MINIKKYIKSNTDGAYIIYVCNNEAAANRLPSGSTFEEIKVNGDVVDTYMKAVDISQDYDDGYAEYEYGENPDIQDLIDELDNQDVGSGSPIVYGIREPKGNLIFDFGFDYFDEMKSRDDQDTDWDEGEDY